MGMQNHKLAVHLIQETNVCFFSLIQFRPCPGGDEENNGVTHTSSVDLKDVVNVTWMPANSGNVEGVYFQ